MRFVDTSFWIGLLYGHDQRHATARALWRNERNELATTNLVLGETWTFLRRRIDHTTALRFIELVERSQHIRVVRVDADTERAAWTWLRRHDERVYSFVDATSFAVMRQLGISEALAFDGDFSAAGFVELRP